MPTSNNLIEKLIFTTPGFLYFNSKNYIEVQVGVFSPLVINVKATFKSYNVRSKIVEQLVKQVSPSSICICGIESGGSYYASAVSDILEKPLVLFRKREKRYGVGQRFVGELPFIKNSLVTIIDDVIGEGKISTLNTEILLKLGYQVEICTLFSYLPKMKEIMSQVKISSLTDINKLCQFGVKKSFFNLQDVELIKKECTYSSK